MVPSNPLKADPTRTATLRRQFVSDMRKRFTKLKGKITQLIVKEDVFGLKPNAKNPLMGNQSSSPGSPGTEAAGIGTGGGSYAGGVPASPVTNQRWRFLTDQAKVVEFRTWLETQVQADIIGGIQARQVEEAWWKAYVEQGYRKGGARAFDDARIALRAAASGSEQLAFYHGTREQFLRTAFGRPASIEKVKLLTGRVYTELKGVTDSMGQQLTRTLADGFVRGESPRTIGRNINRDVTKITRTRATTIARTEVIRAHAEGQLDSLEEMGMDEVGVMVEWSTTGDAHVCKLCAPMQGVVFKVAEARGMIPRHPNCRCAHIPANVGEPLEGQVRDKEDIRESIDRSVGAERGRGSKRTLAEQKTQSSWGGSDTGVSKARPRPRVSPYPSKVARIPRNLKPVIPPTPSLGAGPQVPGASLEERRMIPELEKDQRRLRKAIKEIEEGGYAHELQAELRLYKDDLDGVQDQLAGVRDRFKRDIKRGNSRLDTIEKEMKELLESSDDHVLVETHPGSAIKEPVSRHKRMNELMRDWDELEEEVRKTATTLGRKAPKRIRPGTPEPVPEPETIAPPKPKKPVKDDLSDIELLMKEADEVPYGFERPQWEMMVEDAGLRGQTIEEYLDYELIKRPRSTMFTHKEGTVQGLSREEAIDRYNRWNTKHVRQGLTVEEEAEYHTLRKHYKIGIEDQLAEGSFKHLDDILEQVLGVYDDGAYKSFVKEVDDLKEQTYRLRKELLEKKKLHRKKFHDDNPEWNHLRNQDLPTIEWEGQHHYLGTDEMIELKAKVETSWNSSGAHRKLASDLDDAIYKFENKKENLKHFEKQGKDRAHGIIGQSEQNQLKVKTKLSRPDQVHKEGVDYAAGKVGYNTNIGHSKKYRDKLDDAQNWLTRNFRKRRGSSTPGAAPLEPEMELTAYQLPGNKRAFQRGPSEWEGLYCSENAPTTTYVHELSHRFEYRYNDIEVQTEKFRKYRIKKAGTADTKLIDQFPNHNYDAWELGNEDDWAKLYAEGKSSPFYIGKTYNGPATEVITMGIELMFNNPIHFARVDPEFFKFIYGIMSGAL